MATTSVSTPAPPSIDRFGAVEGHGVVAGPGIDDIGATGTVDGVVARPADDGVGADRTDDRHARRQRRRIDILEVGDRDGVAGGLVDIAEIDIGDCAKRQRVDAGAAVDRDFRIVVRNRVVAAAGVDGVGTAAAIDGVVAGAGGDDIAADEPVTVSALVRIEASRFSKFATLTVSPTVWSDPAETAKSTAVMPPAAASTSVSVPVPPSIEVSVP